MLLRTPELPPPSQYPVVYMGTPRSSRKDFLGAMDYATCLTGTRLLIHSLFDEGNYGGRTNQGWTKNLSAIANGTEGAWSWPVMYTKNRHDAKRFDFQHTVA